MGPTSTRTWSERRSLPSARHRAAEGDVRLELGYALLALVNGTVEGPRLTDQVKALRRQLAGELGFVMPSVRIQDNMQLAADAYVIRRSLSRPSSASTWKPGG